MSDYISEAKKDIAVVVEDTIDELQKLSDSLQIESYWIKEEFIKQFNKSIRSNYENN